MERREWGGQIEPAIGKEYPNEELEDIQGSCSSPFFTPMDGMDEVVSINKSNCDKSNIRSSKLCHSPIVNNLNLPTLDKEKGVVETTSWLLTHSEEPGRLTSEKDTLPEVGSSMTPRQITETFLDFKCPTPNQSGPLGSG